MPLQDIYPDPRLGIGGATKGKFSSSAVVAALSAVSTRLPVKEQILPKVCGGYVVCLLYLNVYFLEYMIFWEVHFSEILTNGGKIFSLKFQVSGVMILASYSMIYLQLPSK